MRSFNVLAWYGKQRWRNKAKRQMREHPLCVMCLQKGIVTAAQVADHIVPHKGNEYDFWNGALQSLCSHCHEQTKKHIETLGFSKEVDNNGLPIDSAHPFNKVR